MKIVRITADEFETEDGNIYKHTIPLKDIPSLEEFQEIYDKWFNMLVKKDG
jgi:hypothetical protein